MFIISCLYPHSYLYWQSPLTPLFEPRYDKKIILDTSTHYTLSNNLTIHYCINAFNKMFSTNNKSKPNIDNIIINKKMKWSNPPNIDHSCVFAKLIIGLTYDIVVSSVTANKRQLFWQWDRSKNFHSVVNSVNPYLYSYVIDQIIIGFLF